MDTSFFVHTDGSGLFQGSGWDLASHAAVHNYDRLSHAAQLKGLIQTTPRAELAALADSTLSAPEGICVLAGSDAQFVVEGARKLQNDICAKIEGPSLLAGRMKWRTRRNMHHHDLWLQVEKRLRGYDAGDLSSNPAPTARAVSLVCYKVPGTHNEDEVRAAESPLDALGNLNADRFADKAHCVQGCRSRPHVARLKREHDAQLELWTQTQEMMIAVSRAVLEAEESCVARPVKVTLPRSLWLQERPIQLCFNLPRGTSVFNTFMRRFVVYLNMLHILPSKDSTGISAIDSFENASESWSPCVADREFERPFWIC